MKNIKLMASILMVLLFVSSYVKASGKNDDHNAETSVKKVEVKHETHGEASPDNHEKEAPTGIKIDADKRKEAGIIVETIQLKQIAETVKVPAEIKAHGYRSLVVTPRISSMVIQRHVVLGDHVVKNQPLATLFSVDMAKAQGEFIVATTEWKRVKKLGKSVVSEKRYVGAEVTYNQAKARLQAYGMAEKEIAKLIKSGSTLKAGEFTLFSTQEGTITSDNFQAGEIIEPGRTLFNVIDERVLWVEAHVSPDYSHIINNGDKAWVHVGKMAREAKVVQKSHVLDETTRTLTIRLEVDNKDHALTPGQFVDVEMISSRKSPAIAVPSEAVLRSSDGDWQIFIEDQDGRLSPLEIDVVRHAGNIKVIKGIAAGTRVVTKGAFFVQSEVAKGGFDIHNH